MVNFTAFRCVLQLMGGCYGFAFFCLLVGTWDVLDGGKISFLILSLWIVNIMYEMRRFLYSFCVFLQGDTKGSAKGGDGSAKKEAHPTPIPQVHYMSMIFFFSLSWIFWCFLLTFSFFKFYRWLIKGRFPKELIMQVLKYSLSLSLSHTQIKMCMYFHNVFWRRSSLTVLGASRRVILKWLKSFWSCSEIQNQ